jgi:hypothetical protein
MGATILKFWAKLQNPYKILIAVLFLPRESDEELIVNHLHYLRILARDFNLVKFPILELCQVMTK